jgi:hypothetical protein
MVHPSARFFISSVAVAVTAVASLAGCGTPNPAGTGGAGGTGSTCGCLAETLTWGPNGGLVAYQDQSSITPCRTYTHERHHRIDDRPDVSCTRDVTDCATSLAGTRLDALLQPDVLAEFARGPVLYGRDLRPVDGSVFRISWGGKYVEVGAPCGTQVGCKAVPAGIQSLVDLLRGVDQQELSRPACSGLFP